MQRKLIAILAAVGALNAAASEAPKGFALIPAGKFEMGDHFGFVDPKHGSDETPVHTVRLDSFLIGINDVTTQEYCGFLNAALANGSIEVRKGGVYLAGGTDLLCDTRQSSVSSPIGWDGKRFTVLDKKEAHPMVCVRWHGAAVYCNWLSAQNGAPACYNTATWDCDFNQSGFRLPTEAEWENAARGGHKDPYFNYPWGNDADPAKANVPQSDNPFRAGPRPTSPPAGYAQEKGAAGQAWRIGTMALTTPVGFFNGKLQRKADFGWPGSQETYQTSNGANGYGLFDMAGNVWQWCNDWYVRDYYAYSPSENPPGPAQGSPMFDGKPYRCMRGGNWFNGEFGHSRVSNRDPSFFRGPDPATGLSDADGPWFHIGFRVVRPIDAESRPAIKPTIVQESGGRGPRPQGREENRPSPQTSVPPASETKTGSFQVRSSAVVGGGELPKEFTGDGAGISPPLEWSGAPAGTKSYALIMHHLAPQGETKCYWVLYNIPATVHSLPKDVKGVGTFGMNTIQDRAAYAPPHSKGPGAKTYVMTIYALSEAPSGANLTREALLAAMKGKILASADLSVNYTRTAAEIAAGEKQIGPIRPIRPMEEQPRPQGGGGGGGGRIAEANKTPASPNPGQTVGLFLDTPKAFAGYTLFAPKHNTVTYLMDNQGRAVHQWKSEYEPGQSVYLKPNGNLLHTCQTKNRSFTGGGEGGRIEEYDWSGKMVWEFWYTNEQHQQHHDIVPLPNGNILMLVVEKKTIAECIAAGFLPQMLRDKELYPDSVVEVQPIYPNGGKIVWEWHVWDHMIQDFDRTKANFGDVAAHPELIYVGGGRGAPAFWNHVNSIAYNAKLDQVVISARGNNEIWFIDHSTSLAQSASHSGGFHGKGGDLIYRWGNPAAYKRGTASDAQLVQQHNAEWIPDGSPGAGHLTIFNNGYDRGYSSIEEIVPPMDAAGRYILEPGKPYGPAKPVWHYEAKNRTDFFSSEISGAQRLPNGNTLICAGVMGNIFEVTAAGETVWQYVNPVVRGGILAQGEVPGKDVRGHLFNAVFKLHRYSPEYPGLKGRDLTPKGVLELPASQKGKTGMDKADALPGERPPGPGGKNGPGSEGGPEQRNRH